jgi:hypothetical protein
MRQHFVALRLDGQTPKEAILLTADFVKEDDTWVGTCLELGTSTYSEDLESLRKELEESILLQLEEVEKLGFLEDYLTERKVPRTPITTNYASGTPSGRWLTVTGV